MCTRTLYVAEDNATVITGRNMDWQEYMHTALWALPAGMQRDSAAKVNPFSWTAKYGSVIVAGYQAGSADGMNEKGLVANLLYLAESDYGQPSGHKPQLSISVWAQYVLDNFACVAEAVAALRQETFDVVAPVLPNGAPASLHLSLSDAAGDSAIFEYIAGHLVIHHDKAYRVMTNSPSYDQQLAISTYWQQIGGLVFLPGTNRAADRFARASFLLEAIPKKIDPNFIAAVPGQTLDHQAVASVMSVQRSVSVPLGITTPDQPNISSTIWRTVCDHKNLNYYFDSATAPNTFWVALEHLDLSVGAPTQVLALNPDVMLAGEVSAHFVPAKPFTFLPG